MSIESRLDRIEKQLEPDKGVCLRWPNPDGTFTEVPGCRSLNDPRIAIGIARLDKTNEHRKQAQTD